MKPDWEAVDAHFEALAQLPASERDAYLGRHKINDPEVINQLNVLCAAYDKGLNLFEQPLDRHITDRTQEQIQAASVEEFNDPMLGQSLGAYRLLSRLGEGGMGAVYLAERQDGAYRQQVAVKLIADFGLKGRLEDRLKREREILARLIHPNICRILDGGCSETGVQYLVMECIHGTDLVSYIKQHQSDLPTRLKIFRKICNAVAYAHQQLVIHCDIKPGNILMTPDGQPVLLDFGIARLLGEQIEQPQEQVTYVRALTPDYASPEQIRQEPVDTTTDVYSLGIILYEILTLTRPYQFKGQSLQAISDFFESAKPVQLMTAGTAESAAVSVNQQTSELDAIIQQSVRVEKTERYPSVSAFEKDITAFLDRRPIMARPQTRWYHLRKAIYRHRMASALAAMLMIALLSMVAITWLKNIELQHANQVATAKQKEAETTLDFVFASIGGNDLYVNASHSFTVSELLNTISERAMLELIEQPQLQAAVLLKLGQAYIVSGSLTESLSDRAEAQLQKALEALASDPNTSAKQLAYAELRLGAIKVFSGDFDAGAEIIEKNFDVALSVANEKDELLRAAYQQMGNLRYRQRRDREAEVYLERALNLYHQNDAQDCQSGGYPSLANTYWYLLVNQRRFEKGKSYLQAAIAACKRYIGGNSGLLRLLTSNMGLTYAWQGQYEQADAYFRELYLQTKNSAADIGEEQFSRAMFFARNLLELRQYQEAFEVLSPFFGLERVQINPAQTDLAFRPQLAGLYAESLHGLGEVDRARAVLKEALSMSESFQTGSRPQRIRVLFRLSRFYWREGHTELYERFKSEYLEEKGDLVMPGVDHYQIEKAL